MEYLNELIDRIDTNNYLIDLDAGIYDMVDVIDFDDMDIINIKIYEELEDCAECSL